MSIFMPILASDLFSTVLSQTLNSEKTWELERWNVFSVVIIWAFYILRMNMSIKNFRNRIPSWHFGEATKLKPFADHLQGREIQLTEQQNSTMQSQSVVASKTSVLICFFHGIRSRSEKKKRVNSAKFNSSTSVKVSNNSYWHRWFTL